MSRPDIVESIVYVVIFFTMLSPVISISVLRRFAKRETRSRFLTSQSILSSLLLGSERDKKEPE